MSVIYLLTSIALTKEWNNKMEKPPSPDPFWMQLLENLASILSASFIAAITAGAAYLNRLRKDWAKFRWGMLFLSLLTGGLNGYFVFVICDAAQLSWQATAIATGASGGAGWELLKYIIGRVNRDIKVG